MPRLFLPLLFNQAVGLKPRLCVVSNSLARRSVDSCPPLPVSLGQSVSPLSCHQLRFIYDAKCHRDIFGTLKIVKTQCLGKCELKCHTSLSCHARGRIFSTYPPPPCHAMLRQATKTNLHFTLAEIFHGSKVLRNKGRLHRLFHWR